MGDGTVHPRARFGAIEKKEDALALLAQNKKKFALDHMYIIPGTALEALKNCRFRRMLLSEVLQEI